MGKLTIEQLIHIIIALVLMKLTLKFILYKFIDVELKEYRKKVKDWILK